MGIGDIHGMLEAHAMASGMGGMRTAGDLVARMEMTGMRLDKAKEYVAKKLNVSTFELSDCVKMTEVRDNLQLGLIAQMSGRPKGMAAKFHIAEVLGIRINCVEQFKERAGLPVGAH